jgi:hypothetical protein
MNTPWAVRVPLPHIAALGRLRTCFGIDAAPAPGDDAVWLRGRDLDESLEQALRALPLAERFQVLDDGRLCPADGVVPTGRLPELDWRPLGDVIRPTLPTPALAGRAASKCPLRLVRSAAERTPNVLLVAFDALAGWALHAPEVRLHACRFAVRADGLAVVHGEPLPPLAGRLFVKQHGVAAPAGWTWLPAIPAAVVAESLSLAEGDLVLLHADAPQERIAADQFVRATRSAVRNTREAIARA